MDYRSGATPSVIQYTLAKVQSMNLARIASITAIRRREGMAEAGKEKIVEEVVKVVNMVIRNMGIGHMHNRLYQCSVLTENTLLTG